LRRSENQWRRSHGDRRLSSEGSMEEYASRTVVNFSLPLRKER
jgi:hypothetical protein